MGHYTESDLNSQQLTLTTRDYDVRITNLLRFIYKKLKKKKGSLIDIGAGNGLALQFFRDKGFTVTGMELSKKLCVQMKKNPFLKGITIQQGSITQAQGKEDYDYVLASDVIEHIENETLAIKNLFSFVKKGGMLVISVPAHSFLFGKRDVEWGHFRRYDKKGLLSLTASLDRQHTEFVTYWNLSGFFVYFLYEKLLKKAVPDDFRYKKTKTALFKQKTVELLLKTEEFFGFMPWGLTLIVGIRKN